MFPHLVTVIDFLYSKPESPPSYPPSPSLYFQLLSQYGSVCCSFWSCKIYVMACNWTSSRGKACPRHSRTSWALSSSLRAVQWWYPIPVSKLLVQVIPLLGKPLSALDMIPPRSCSDGTRWAPVMSSSLCCSVILFSKREAKFGSVFSISLNRDPGLIRDSSNHFYRTN